MTGKAGTMAGVAAGAATGTTGIRFERHGAAAIAIIDRPERRNAVSQPMQQALAGWYPRLARDAGVYAVIVRSALDGVLSVGGDVREVLDMAASDVAAVRVALGRELALCWLHECFSKPTVSLIDGQVMGTGVGITLYGTHRVAGEGYRFQMPETAIGYFPDCGVVHAFARMPHGLGLYLGLTGEAVGRADALALGLATHCISRASFGAIVSRLGDADPVDPVLDGLHEAQGVGPLMAMASRCARYFEAPTLADTFRRLAEPAAGDEAWAAATLATLRARSPLALALTDRAIRNAAALDIRGALMQDYRLAWRLVAGHDFREGVRAALIDKDRRPRWQHACLEDVPASLVAEHFAPLGADELVLATRAEMQASRV
jgi:enoyl-CoA hydratase